MSASKIEGLKAFQGKVIGEGDCTNCGHAVQVKVNSGTHLYYHCPPHFDGGCGLQYRSTSAKADELLAAKVKKWRLKEARQVIQGKTSPAPDDEPKGDDPVFEVEID